jgi:alpha-tubulin suppressor-like RCC1 family protein
VSVSTLTGVTALAAGLDHTLARTSSGSVYAWGANATYGALGDGTTTNRDEPVQVTALSSISVIAAGHQHSLAVSSTGVVSTWGRNEQSQLGDGTTETRLTPGAISGTGYDWKVGTPTFNVASGTYTTDKTVTVTVETAGATIYYTQDGDEPTEADPTVTSGGTVSVTTSQTLKAKAWKSGQPPSDTQAATYTLQVAQPSFSPAAGT